MEPVLHRRVIAALVFLAALRTWAATLAAPPADLLAPSAALPTILPDLAHDGWDRLSLLPDIGPERARRLVALRPFLGVPLDAQRLEWIPGFGPLAGRKIADWTRRMAAENRTEAPGGGGGRAERGAARPVE